MLKPLSALLALLVLHTCVYAQSMQAKQYNFTTFSTDKKVVPDALNQYSSAKAKQHPEYGVLPPHTQCQNCVELIDKRGMDTREYIDPYQPGHTYSQRSYFPLHYKKHAEDVWHSIDERLHPTETPGVFIADKQPTITKADINRKLTSITVQGVEIEFNKNVSMYFADGSNAQSATIQGDYSHYTAGDEGLRIKDMWQGIDAEQAFKLGEVKSTYIVKQPLNIPITQGHLVIEDHFTLPEGFSIHETAEGLHTDEGYYQGDYLIKNAGGETFFTYKSAALYDARVWGIAGSYQLIKNGNECTLKLLVPISWLQLPENKYPLFIDPPFSGTKKTGDYLATAGGIPDAMGFTTIALGSCDHTLDSVRVGGRSDVTNAYVEIEYELQYSPFCGNPALPTPFCTVSQVRQRLVSNQCNTNVVLVCNEPIDSNYIGRCTTDSNAFPGAGPINVTNFVPNFLNCVAPTCNEYHYLDFTLKNQDSICGDVCGYLCAAGTYWAMTLEACKVEGNISQDKTQVCAGEPVVFTAHPSCGVPPYHFIWSVDGGNTFDTVYNTPTYTYIPQTESPPGGFIIQCFIFDDCSYYFDSDDASLTVLSSPAADAGPDQITCLGGAVQLGGNPTTDNGASITWTGSSPLVQSWLTSNSFPNPTTNIPAGTIDTFFYVVRTSNGGTCIRRDTVYVFSIDGPIANAGSDVNLCSGGTAVLGGTPSASPGFNIEWTGYGNPNVSSWLSGANTANPTINIPPGTVDTLYYAIQVFSNQCSRGDTMAVFLPQPPLANAGADVNLCEGGTATIGGTPAAGPGTTVVWSANNTTAENWLSSTTAQNPQVIVPAGTLGNYQYYLTVTDPNCSRIDTIILSSYQNPVAIVDTSGPTLICSNASVTLSVAGNYSTYLWNNGATTQSTAISSAGNYFVVVTDANSCMDSSNVITVNTIPAPVVMVFPDTSINYGDSLTLYTDIGLNTVDSFMWYPDVNISCLYCTNPTVAPQEDTYYGIYVYANGCPANDSALIKIILKNNYYLPNAFTPNGDGNNDDFYILAQKGVKVIEFQIFNRIGEKIHDGLFPWNGSYKGIPCPPGSYVYQVRMGLFGEDQGIFRKGSVTLIR